MMWKVLWKLSQEIHLNVKDENPICQGSGAMNNVKVYEK